MSDVPISKQSKDFFEQVYEVARHIPRGRVTSFGAIAKCLGMARSSRMVGWAMSASHAQLVPVPAHRVVNRNGVLTGKMHFEHPMAMQEMLEQEGVEVENDQVVRFKELFWDPQTALSF